MRTANGKEKKRKTVKSEADGFSLAELGRITDMLKSQTSTGHANSYE